MSVKDKLGQVKDDFQELGAFEFSKKYKKSLITAGAVGITAGLYLWGTYTAENPCQDLSQSLQQICDTNSVHYQLQKVESLESEIEDCWQNLGLTEQEYGRPRVRDMIDEVKEAYKSIDSNLEMSEVSQVARDALDQELKEATKTLLRKTGYYFDNIEMPFDILDKAT